MTEVAQEEAVETPPTEPGDGSGGGPPDKGRWGNFIDDVSGVNVDWQTAVVVPLLAVATALIVGGLIVVFTDPDLWKERTLDALGSTLGEVLDAYIALFQGSFGSLRSLSETIVNTTPLILAGLSVAIGFRAGLFNIGAQGQMLIGGMFAAYVGFTLDLPIIIHLPAILIAAIIGGAIWGGIPGWLRAKTGAHEVITTIMLNNIAGLLVLYWLSTSLFQAEGRTDPVSEDVLTSGRLPRLLGFLDRSDLRIHAGIIVALLAAYFVWWLLQRSTIGFEIRAVGFSPTAAKYAGMRVTTMYVVVMALAGALAGLAGAAQVNGVLYRATPGFAGAIGFDAISLALLGRSHPAGVVAAAFLFGALRAGGQEMQVATNVSIDLILVMQALIVVFIAAPALIRAIYRVRTGEGAGQLTKGWAT